MQKNAYTPEHGPVRSRAIKTTAIAILTLGLLAGSAVGVAAQDADPAQIETPAYYTWTVGQPANIIPGTWDESTGELRGEVFEAAPIEASDSRFSGLGYVVNNGNRDESSDGRGIIESRSYRVVTDDCTWSGTGTFVFQADFGPPPPALARETVVVTGEGACEGLVSFSTADYREGSSGEALVLRVPVPPVPDLPMQDIATDSDAATSHAAVVARLIGKPCVASCAA